MTTRPRRSMVQAGIVLTAGQLVATAAQLAFHIYAGRSLQPEEYGGLGALMSLFMIVSLPLNTLMLQITSDATGLRLGGNPLSLRMYVDRQWRRLWGWGFVVLAGMLVLSAPLSGWLRLSGPVPVMIMGLVLAGSLIVRLPYGLMQGGQAFGWYALFVAGVPVLRLILAFFMPATLTGAMGALALTGMLEIGAGAVLVSYLGSRFVLGGESPDPVQTARLAFGTTLIVQCALAVLTNADMLILKNLHPGAESGDYSILVQIARGITFFPVTIVSVLFPRVTERRMLGQGSRFTLLKSCVAAVGLVAIWSLPCVLFPELIVSTLFHSEYAHAADLLRWVWWFAAPLALCTVLAHYLIARHDPWLPLLLVAGVATHLVLLATIGAASPLAMVGAVGLGGTIVAIPLAIRAARPETDVLPAG